MIVCRYPAVSLAAVDIIVLVFLAFSDFTLAVLNPGCECITLQKTGTKLSGQFSSPGYPSPYRGGISCLLYTFIAPDDTQPMIVEVLFTDLDLGEVNRYGNCNTGDKLRVYLRQTTPAINEEVKADTQICGNLTTVSRRRFYSVNRILILELFTDETDIPAHRGFKGTFNFIPQAQFISEGIQGSGSECSYYISAGATTSGKFFSPDYPQNYPPNTNCSWTFSGDWDETVKVTFLKIDLATQPTSGQRECNSSETGHDLITVYDGDNTISPVIGRFCGYGVHEQVTSSGKRMKVIFTSNSQLSMQGFTATFKFTKPVAQPKRTCDATIYSKYQMKSTITSPLYPEPYSSGNMCIYKFYGSANQRVAIKFLEFDLDDGEGSDSSNSSTCALKDKLTVSIQVDNSYLQTLKVFCGSSRPPAIMSNGPFLQLKFEAITSNNKAKGFNISFEFVTDFGIKADEVVSYAPCTFWYRKSMSEEGAITSPNYPWLYPKDTLCQYLFDGEGSQIWIKFTDFDVFGHPPLCEEERNSDYVRLSNYRDTEDKMMSSYCISNQTPEHILNKPIISDKDFFMITFKSGMAGSGTGFRAQYKFLSAEETESSGQTSENNSRRSSEVICSLLFTLLFISTSYILQ